MSYIVSLKEFDGPLDLLLTLISNAKIDIQDIFVSQITEQYLETMSLVDELDMDSASEFLQMAATLLEIKSRAMLPKPPKPEDPDELSPEEALIKQLEEYRQFKEVSARMHQLEEEARALLTKLPEEFRPHVLEERSVSWLCDCSRERMAKALVSIGRKDLTEIIEEDHGAELTCQFCLKKYYFDEQELRTLLEEASHGQD